MKYKGLVIRNIPNHEQAHALVNKLRTKGIHTRKRGRGARATPVNWRGLKCLSGGEYQDLPLTKASRFSMYFDKADWRERDYNKIYFDYIGEDNGKPRIKLNVR